MKALSLTLLLTLGLAAPALAGTPPTQPVSETAPARAADEGMPLDNLIEAATTMEDRAALLRRCAGPPAKLVARPIETDAVKEAAVTAGTKSGGG